MGWAEMGLLLADLLRSWGEEVGSAKSVSSLGGRTFRPEKPAWGFPIPLQYNRPLGFGNLARKSARFRNIHINTFKENYNPESPFPALDLNSPLYLGGGPPHNPGVNEQMLF